MTDATPTRTRLDIGHSLRSRASILEIASACSVFGLLAGIAPGLTAHAADFPSKPIRIIVPYAPGGNIDITARTIAPGLSSQLGQQVVVDNRGGADGRVGTQAAARSAPDGHTLLLGANAALTITPVFADAVGYDAVRDFSPISLVSIIPLVMETHPALPTRTVKDLVALAKVKPGRMTVASQGSGGYLTGELFQLATDSRLTIIRYRGSGPALVDLMSGQVDLMFDQISSSLALIRAGKIRALAVTTQQRSSLMPEVPTMDESGVGGFEASTYTGLLLPAGTSGDIVNRVGEALRKVLDAPATVESFGRLGADVIRSTPERFAERLKSDVAKWSDVKRRTKIVLE